MSCPSELSLPPMLLWVPGLSQSCLEEGTYLLGKAFFYPKAHFSQNSLPPGVMDTLGSLQPLFELVGVIVPRTRPMEF